MYQRAALLEGELAFKNEIGQGVMVRLEIPLGISGVQLKFTKREACGYNGGEQMEITESKMKELSTMASALADAYSAGKLSPEEAAEFEAIKERINELLKKAKARLERG
jgi:hypothetical protein